MSKFQRPTRGTTINELTEHTAKQVRSQFRDMDNWNREDIAYSLECYNADPKIYEATEEGRKAMLVELKQYILDYYWYADYLQKKAAQRKAEKEDRILHQMKKPVAIAESAGV
jgi:hypothetical protein